MEFKSKSSTIEKVKYDKEKKTLTVTFKTGATYVYTGVSETEYLFFKEAKSHGTFHHSRIKPKYKGKLKKD